VSITTVFSDNIFYYSKHAICSGFFLKASSENKHCVHRALLIKEETEIATLTKIHVGFIYILAETELEVHCSIIYVLRSFGIFM